LTRAFLLVLFDCASDQARRNYFGHFVKKVVTLCPSQRPKAFGAWVGFPDTPCSFLLKAPCGLTRDFCCFLCALWRLEGMHVDCILYSLTAMQISDSFLLFGKRVDCAEARAYTLMRSKVSSRNSMNCRFEQSGPFRDGERKGMRFHLKFFSSEVSK
jgi:hypothetical protein